MHTSLSLQMRATLKELSELYSKGPTFEHAPLDGDGDILTDYVQCTVCSSSECDDANDILMCDNVGCFRAFHANCCDPPIAPEVLTRLHEEDNTDDWFCW